VVFPGLVKHRDWGLLALRVAVGIVFIVHGWPKLANAESMSGMFGGPNPISTALVAMQGLVETLGGIALILGLWAQLVAVAFALIMLAAITLKNTVFPTGFASPTTTGWEFDFVLLAANVAILLVGPGRFGLVNVPIPRARERAADEGAPRAGESETTG
jgi:putative oxidoreductase